MQVEGGVGARVGIATSLIKLVHPMSHLTNGQLCGIASNQWVVVWARVVFALWRGRLQVKYSVVLLSSTTATDPR